ncbi:MAG: TlyA family RNA methyltransferase, partial [Actinomycetota bacterium]
CTASSSTNSSATLTKSLRLDAELVRRGLAGSRTEARLAIEAGVVLVNGLPATRPATRVTPASSVSLEAPARRFVSRGGEKLDGALRRLDVAVAERAWLDAGASTGGFTDRLLQGGARAVVAVDVGYGQFDWSLRNDGRVTLLERTNVRNLLPGALPFAPEGIVADLSFISLTVVLPALVGVAAPGADFVLMVKPQFEVGRDAVGRKGVVRDPAMWRIALKRVVEDARSLGLSLVGAVPSEVAGPAGNREFFVHLRRHAPHNEAAIEAAVRELSGGEVR